MIFPFIVIGTCLLVIVSLKDSKTSNRQHSSTQVTGNPVNLTSHLAEFAALIRNGHRPSQWLVTNAISEAYEKGDWKLAKAISDSYPSEIAVERRKRVTPEKKEVKKEAELPAASEESQELQKQLDFNPHKTTSPIDGINNDDWRMFIEVSRIENPEFNKDNLIGMFRQNKKRLEKMGISPEDLKTPVDQYNAFESECVQLLNEGNNLIKQSVAMPINVDGEDVPVTLSGLLTVMHHAGVQNAAKWLDSKDERKKFPNTTEAFKRSNGCF